MPKKKATSSDVARKAGVSQATVSMVLNRKYNVSFSRETVEKVEQAARELGYQLPGRKNKKDSKKEKLIVVFCPNSDQSVLRASAPGSRGSSQQAGLRRLYLQYTERCPAGGEIPPHDAHHPASGNHLQLAIQIRISAAGRGTGAERFLLLSSVTKRKLPQ